MKSHFIVLDYSPATDKARLNIPEPRSCSRKPKGKQMF